MSHEALILRVRNHNPTYEEYQFAADIVRLCASYADVRQRTRWRLSG
jgi:hypothetical protein